jgi:hypothetical protein
MAVTIYKPTLAAVQELAKQARTEEASHARGDLTRGKFVDGANIIRPTPPTNARGILGKKNAKHFFNESPFKNSIEHPMTCVEQMFDSPIGSCPICTVANNILAQIPDLKARWIKPGITQDIQAVDRMDPANPHVAKIYSLTPPTYNWLLMQLEELLMLQTGAIDLTDINCGFDVRIMKVQKPIKGGRTMTNYVPGLWPVTGPIPLAPTPEGINQILASLKDLDAIYKYPSDEQLADLHKAASMIQSHYLQAAGNMIQVPQFKGTGQVVVPQSYQPAQQQQPVQQYQPQQVQVGFLQQPAQPPVQQYFPQSVQQQLLQLPQPMYVQPVQQVQNPASLTQQNPVQPAYQQPVQQPPQQVYQPNISKPIHPQSVVQAPVAPQPVPQAVAAPVAPSTPLAPLPTDKIPCFGGAAPRSQHPGFNKLSDDGGVGYGTDSELCLTCKDELKCIEICKQNKSNAHG